jgi:autoinducer 2-degrading protein
MYHVISYFDLPPERHEEFIEAALKDREDSLADEGEPGTKRFEVIKDKERANRFCLNEAYEDEAAFDTHRAGEHFTRFFAFVGKFTEAQPGIEGTGIDDRPD